MIALVGLALAGAAVSPWPTSGGPSPDGVLRGEGMVVLAASFVAVGMIPVLNGIKSILADGSVSQVVRGVVQAVAVEVPNNKPTGPRAMVEEGDQLMDVEPLRSPVNVGNGSEVAGGTSPRNGQCLPVSALPLDARDDLMAGRTELIPRCPRDGQEAIMATIDRDMNLTGPRHSLILAGSK